MPLEARATGTGFSSSLAAATWQVRDVAADSALSGADSSGKGPRLKLELARRDEPVGPDWRSSCAVVSSTPADRAVTLALVIPIDLRGGIWWDDPQRSRPISGKEPFANLVDSGFGATGMASRYPMAVVSKGDRALCLAVPLEPPRMVRFVYDPVKRELRAEFDFGLSNLPKRFASRADAAVIAYEIPARWAFRQALARYYELQPDAFKRRVKKVGIWLPFSRVDEIERPEDFGITCHELAMHTLDWASEDEKHGVDSYVYVEPQTNWRSLRGEGQRGYEAWVAQLWEDAIKGDARAQATLTSGIEREDGRRDLYLGPVAYTTSAPFGANCDPDLPTEDWGAWPNKARVEMSQIEKALGWTDGKPTGVDGVYIDSMEGWGQIGDYCRAHWRETRCPLTFDTATHKVCLLNFWGTYAFVKSLSEKLHARGLCLMGNDAYYRFWFLAPFVDIPGREYRWIENGKWSPVPDENYLFFRSMAAGKPYLMLMNNDYEDASHMEEYFQRSLFYAVYPSMFHAQLKIGEAAYFTNPKWYNRDRPLFVKCVPLIRKLDMAGWRPVPFADVRPESIRIERYGDFASGNLAFALHNPTDRAQATELLLSRSELGLAEQVSASEWITGKPVTAEATGGAIRLRLDLPPSGYAVVGTIISR